MWFQYQQHISLVGNANSGAPTPELVVQKFWGRDVTICIFQSVLWVRNGMSSWFWLALYQWVRRSSIFSSVFIGHWYEGHTFHQFLLLSLLQSQHSLSAWPPGSREKEERSVLHPGHRLTSYGPRGPGCGNSSLVFLWLVVSVHFLVSERPSLKMTSDPTPSVSLSGVWYHCPLIAEKGRGPRRQQLPVFRRKKQVWNWLPKLQRGSTSKTAREGTDVRN